MCRLFLLGHGAYNGHAGREIEEITWVGLEWDNNEFEAAAVVAAHSSHASVIINLHLNAEYLRNNSPRAFSAEC